MKKVGVIVGRFQIDELHFGHQKLIRQAYEECDRVLVLIGTRVVRSDSDPLPYALVSASVKSIRCASVSTAPLYDYKHNDMWLQNLINTVNSHTEEEEEIVFYGSRDSFLDFVPDTYKKVRVDQEGDISASELRSKIGYKDQQVFREGYIRAVMDEFPAHYAVVDAIITDGEQVLLGLKDSGPCLIGGFADDADNSLEDAAIREAEEECKLKLRDASYLMSAKCEDWRYSRARQPFTSVFVFKVKDFSGAMPGDDIKSLMIVPLSEAEEVLKDSFHAKIIKKYIDVSSKSI